MCDGQELHEHFSLLTETFIEHRHIHDCMDENYNSLHHHPPVDHHICTEDELHNEERDTGRWLNDTL